MRRGTTYRIRFNISQNLLECDALHIAFKNRKNVIVKAYPDEVTLEPAEDNGCSVSTVLNQEETLSFRAGSEVTTQIRCRMDDVAYATPIYVITGSEGVANVLEEGVI